MSGSNKYLVVIAGPTAVGKTNLAITLAKKYNTEIISFDSRQFYREMSIGTAKPDFHELAEVPHHFINNLSIHQNYSIGNFENEAMACLNSLFNKHRLVIAVGGSGLYINALLNGLDDFVNIKLSTKEKAKLLYEEKGISALQNELRRLDPDYFNEVDINNPQRLMRALEVCWESGLPYSSFLGKNQVKRNFEAIKILLNLPREKLYYQINQRVDKMMAEGLENEVKKLLPFRHLNALNTVGYKELFTHYDGKISLNEAVDLIKQKTRNYAKRQLTWFKHQDSYRQFAPDELGKIISYIDLTTQGL